MNKKEEDKFEHKSHPFLLFLSSLFFLLNFFCPFLIFSNLTYRKSTPHKFEMKQTVDH